MGWKFVLSLFFALAVAVFAIQNAAAVEVNFLLWEVNISQALIVLVSAIFGALAVLLMSIVKQMKLQSNIRSEKKTVSSLQKENQELKVRLDQELAKAAEFEAAGVKASDATFAEGYEAGQ